MLSLPVLDRGDIFVAAAGQSDDDQIFRVEFAARSHAAQQGERMSAFNADEQHRALRLRTLFTRAAGRLRCEALPSPLRDWLGLIELSLRIA